MTFDDLERRRKRKQRAMCRRENLCERCWQPKHESPSKQMCVDCLIYRRLYVRNRQGSVSYGERQEGRHPGGRPPLPIPRKEAAGQR